MASRLKRSASKARHAKRVVRVVAAEPIKGQFDSFKDLHPEIADAVKEFNEAKRIIPPRRLSDKMKDHRLDGKLQLFRECHLAGDVLLIYTHEGDDVRMLCICRHDDLYKKNFRTTLKKLNEGLAKK